MNIQKLFLASAFFLCFCKAGFAEGTDMASYEYRYKLFGAGFKQQKISFLSPLFYEGASLIYSSSGKTSFQNGKLTSYYSDMYFDFLPNPNNNSMIIADGGNIEYNKYWLLKVDEETSSNLFVGWGYWFDYQLAVKPDNTNNLLYYHFNNMGCLSFATTGRIKSVRIFDELSIPVVGVYFGSQYSSPLPYFVYEKDANFFDDFDILFINKNLQLKNTLSADFKLKFWRRYTTMRVQYVVSIRTLRLNNNEMANIYHLFKIGYLLNNYAHK
ncbi:MAG: hypothetical protein LBF67_08415 [Prevotellaceae bacterium]|jgi:hypothetical protein|nr:hypothetical protein [Prevotellaceae bacterium]